MNVFRKIILAIIILPLFLSSCNVKFTQDSQSKVQRDGASIKEKAMVENIKSPFDYNQNGIDDYSDFVIGAKLDAKNKPYYDPSYIGINGGYPNEDKGVCTDVIWRAFKEAGYSIRTMLNEDIKQHRQDYSAISDKPNPNIDFRRVKTLMNFFDKYCLVLETEMTDPYAWQPGDIVVFEPNDYHIGLLSDNRNEDGYPLVIHNMGQKDRENDFLKTKRGKISRHYRFDGEKIDSNVLKPWVDGEDKH